MESHFEMPANDWRGPITVSWYQGGALPKPPEGASIKGVGHGAMFEGTKGTLVSGFGNHKLYPIAGSDLSHYTPRPKEKRIPALGSFQKQWINGCKGDLRTACDFKYSGDAIELMLLGLVAYRVGEKLAYDGKAGKVTNSAEGDALLKKKYREGWTLFG
jgi:hypothetical protein